jgi:alpha-galactosidase
MNGTLGKVFAVGSLLAGGAFAQKVAMTPPMGWNSWNTFYGNINESLIKGIVDVMGTNGMKAAGYIYVNLDDNWMSSSRDASGNLQADPAKFPNGIKALSDYAHGKGMKLGIYGDHGSKTCMGVANSGSYGHEAADAKTFASWGVDYIKYDNCNIVSGSNQQTDYQNMATAIANSGRPMVFSICAWQTQAWMPDVGNLWRSTDDITSDWLGSQNSLGRAIMVNLDGNAGNFIFTRPGAFSDPDMLEVGNGTLSNDQNKSHFGLWALMAAPLIAGNDVRSISATNLAIMTNSDVIAVDQDSAGIQGRRILQNGNLETWVKPLGKDFTTYAVGLFNRGGSATSMTINWKDLRLDTNSVKVRDLWAKSDLGSFKGRYSVQVPTNGLALLKVVGTMDPNATYWVSDLPFTQLANGYNYVKVDKSNGGNGLKIGSKSYAKGLGTNSPARIAVPLRKKFSRFQSDIGIDAEVSGGTAAFQVIGDGKTLYTSSTLKGGGSAVSVDVSVEGVDSLFLVTTDGGDGNSYDHADWAGALLVPSTTTAVRAKSTVGNDWQVEVRSGRIVLDRSSPNATEFRMLDLQGREVLRREVSGSHAEISLAAVPRGVYCAVLGDGGTRSTRTIFRD